MKITLTGVIEQEGDWYVAICPEVGVASQGRTVDEARANLTEALELFFECASDAEIKRSLPAKSCAPSQPDLSDQLAKVIARIDRPVNASAVYLTPLEVTHNRTI